MGCVVFNHGNSGALKSGGTWYFELLWLMRDRNRSSGNTSDFWILCSHFGNKKIK